jgi:homoserine kinase type II
VRGHETEKVGLESKRRLAHVLAHYDLGALKTCERIEHGYVNQTWTAETTAGRYVVKRRHPELSEPRLIRGQHALVRHLCAARFPVPYLAATRWGETFLELERDVYEVQEFVPGALCDPDRAAHQKTAARTLGWYHRVVEGFDHPVFHRGRERYGIRALARILDGLGEAWEGKRTPELDRLYRALQRHASDLVACYRGFGRLPELVIHGDFYAENLILQGDAIAGVVDYDLAHWCARTLELAEALIYFAREPKRRFQHIVYPGVLDLGLVERFLASYTEMVGLSVAEVRALPHLIRTIWLCASLDPPLRSRLSAEEAPQAVPEVLALADWAAAHVAEIVEMGLGFVFAEHHSNGLDRLSGQAQVEDCRKEIES